MARREASLMMKFIAFAPRLHRTLLVISCEGLISLHEKCDKLIC